MAGLFPVRGQILAVPEHYAQFHHGSQIFTGGRFLKPFYGLGRILRHSQPIPVLKCQKALCCQVAAFRCLKKVWD